MQRRQGRAKEDRPRRSRPRSSSRSMVQASPAAVQFEAARADTVDRVYCPHFGPCGGCNRLDITYAQELERKESAFRALLAAGTLAVNDAMLPILGAQKPLLWRTSLKLPFARQARRLVCGFYEPGSHRIVDLQTCVVQHPHLLELALVTRDLVRELRVPVYDEIQHRGVLRHLVARVASGTHEMLAGFVVREAGSRPVRRLAEHLMQRLAQAGLVGVVENTNPERTNVILGDRSTVLAGRAWMEERAGGLEFRTTLASFAQVNNEQAEVLYAEALRVLGDVRERRIVDLFAGYGPIGLRLAQRGAQVVAIERNPAAVREGIEAARRNGLEDRIRFAAAAAEEGFEIDEPIDAVIVDPPRRGLTTRVIERLLGMNMSTLVYVSCNPKTLVRDLELLTPAFEVRSLRLVDLFPRTDHVEAVAMLRRRG